MLFHLLQRSLVAMTAMLALSAAVSSSAEEFRLGIGPAIAANATNMKQAVMAVRVEGCPEPAKAHVSGTAEGLVNGERRSVPLTLVPLPTPGSYALNRTWPREGVWVVNLTGVYQDVKAGAVIPIGPTGFMREPSKFYPRPATTVEIDAALKALAASSGTP